MPQHMDPATGKMIDDDPQPEPNIGGLAAQQQEAAAMSPLPIPPAGPTVALGEPTMISPEAASAPGVDTPPEPSPGGLKLPEPSLPVPGAPPGLTLTPPTAGEGGPVPTPGADLIPAPVPSDPNAPLAPSAEPPKSLEPADTVEGIADQKIEERKAQAEEEKAAAETKAAEAKEVAAQQASYAKGRADIIKSGEDAYAASKAKQAAAYDQYRALGEKDAWGDNATGLKVLAGIALLLSGRRAAPYIIGAANGFEANKKEALAQQVEAMKVAGKQTEEVRTHMNDQVANLSQQTAAGLDATAAKMDAELAARGVPKAQRDANKDILEIKQKALEKKEEAQRLAHKQDEADTKEALMNHKIEADTRLSSIRADQIAKKMKGGGGGGGGSDALSKFVESANALQPGDPIPPDLAVLGSRAGFKPNQIAQEVDRYRGSGTKSEKGTAGADKDITTRMNAYEKEAIGNARSPGPVRQLSQVEAMRSTLDEAVKSGDSDRIKAAMIKAKEQAGTLMSGGKLTNAQIKIMHDLESTVDDLTAKIGKFTGNPTEGAGAVKRLSTLIDDAGSETLEQVKTLRQRAVNEHLAPGTGIANTPEKKKAFMSRANGLFSEVRWRGQPVFDEAKSNPENAQPATQQQQSPAGTPKPPQGQKSDADVRASAQRVWNDKAAPPANRARARKWLDTHPEAGDITL